MTEKSISRLRKEIERLNMEILEKLNERFTLVNRIRHIKEKKGMEMFDPQRESEMLDQILLKNKGPMPSDVARSLFKEIFRASLLKMEADSHRGLMVHRKEGEKDRVIRIKGVEMGGSRPFVVAGPCSVESIEQMETVAQGLKRLGVRVLRAGAFKPRTSPYTFQGLKKEGLKILKKVAERYGMVSVTEVLDTRDMEAVAEAADILQIGTRNMFNYELLKLAGRIKKPVLLKRGFMATIEELILAAEYIAAQGNDQILLCERGIRTFETSTRNTLDISAIPILKKETSFPIVIDVSHATGRKDIMLPLAKASLAAGAHGIMVEVHPRPPVALSDSQQQMDLKEFSFFYKSLMEGR